MIESEQTKVCPMCAETIKAAAKVCPHCRHVQVKWSFFNPNITSALVGIFWLVSIVGIGVFVNKIIGRQDFERYQTQFYILESTVSQRIASNGVYVVITGVLTNGSNYPWKSIGLEGQLFDREGKLIDVVVAPSDYYSGVVAASHAIAAFNIESRTSHSLTDYANHKVFVRWAKDATSWP